MTETDRMVVWLREAMDAAQRVAEAATPGPWTADSGQEEIHASDGTVARIRDYVRLMSNAQVEADMALIIRHASPTAALRRIAADRKMLDLLAGDVEYEAEPLAEDALRLLAEGYGWTEETSGQ